MQQSNALTNSSYIFLMSGCAHFSVASSSTSAASTTAVALCPAKHNNKSRAGQLHRKCSSKHYSLAARGVDGGGGAQEKEGTKPRRGRPRKVPVPCDDTPGLLQTIASRTQLPEAIVERVLAARSSTPGISSDADKLCHRIQHLQQLLGPDNANTALHRFPSLVAYSPQTLALNYKQWQLFFGTHEASSAVSSAIGRQLQRSRQQDLVRKVTQNPQMLCTDVEKQVGNLYETGVLIGAPDLHSFAYSAMDLGLCGPQRLQDKLLRVLAVLNSAQLQQPPGQQPGEQQTQSTPSGDAVEDSAAATAAEVSRASPEVPEEAQESAAVQFCLSDVQGAARRDQQWLLLSADTLEQRLLGMQQELQVSMSAVGAMFLKNPSLLNKKPSTVASKLAALEALPGFTQQQAQAAVAAIPSLLNLKPDKLKNRWQLLQEAANTAPVWRRQLDGMSPSTLAGLMIRSDARYQRLQQVVSKGMQEGVPLSTTLNASESAFAARIDKAEKEQYLKKSTTVGQKQLKR